MNDQEPVFGESPRPHRSNVAVVEDHLLQRKRTEELIAAQPGLRVVWSGETLPAFLNWLDGAAAEDRPQPLMLDLMVERGPSASPAAIEAASRAIFSFRNQLRRAFSRHALRGTSSAKD